MLLKKITESSWGACLAFLVAAIIGLAVALGIALSATSHQDSKSKTSTHHSAKPVLTAQQEKLYQQYRKGDEVSNVVPHIERKDVKGALALLCGPDADAGHYASHVAGMVRAAKGDLDKVDPYVWDEYGFISSFCTPNAVAFSNGVHGLGVGLL